MVKESLRPPPLDNQILCDYVPRIWGRDDLVCPSCPLAPRHVSNI